MWRYVATDEEKVECQRRWDDNSEELLPTDPDRIPNTYKKLSDPAPAPTEEGDESADDPEDDPTAPADDPAVPVDDPAAPVDVTPADVNTTAFPFWPDSTEHVVLPTINDIEAHTMKLDLYTSGFHYGPEQRDEKRWKGVHLLGSGTSAVASLWIRRDDNNNVEKVSILSKYPAQH
jgi:hypothetical protein